MFDDTHIGWLLGDDYEVAAALRRQREQTANPDQPDPADVAPRRDLLGELLRGPADRRRPETVPR